MLAWHVAVVDAAVLFAFAKRSFMWYKNVGTSFFRFVTNHAVNRQTDGQTDGRTALS